MLTCCAALIVTALTASPLAAEAPPGAGSASVALRQLRVGDTIEIHTSDRVYRAEIVDPRTGETRASVSADGVRFSAPRKVYLLGATPGKQDHLMMVRMGRIEVGKRVEIGLESREARDRALTEVVRAVRVVSDGR